MMRAARFRCKMCGVAMYQGRALADINLTGIALAEALEAFAEHIVRGRWKDVRQPTESELKQTKVLAVPLEEVSAKVRTGEPHDDEEDYALPIWAGVLPLPIIPGAPIPDSRCLAGLEIPSYLRSYSRNGTK